ncbi:hypothetical protein [Phenylobacterium sp.]|jgi:hypothetical protein|uniref:hypothetical protein n=1 Tax=Phenylobacterium sp. TaxID=1871053 RepID=UPI002E30F48E|nr:hypothetical protein [Phenylobacterium sp.]HEX2559950.1 hypothetical protein [Phenylobacterium sp.]
MPRVLPVFAGGSVLAVAAYFVSSQLLAGATVLVIAAIVVVCFGVGAFTTNLILDWLGR